MSPLMSLFISQPVVIVEQQVMLGLCRARTSRLHFGDVQIAVAKRKIWRSGITFRVERSARTACGVFVKKNVIQKTFNQSVLPKT